MARFRLTAPCAVQYRPGRGGGGAMMLEPGAILDSADMPPHWRPHPTAMEPLDPEAVTMLRNELNAVRQRADTEASIFGLGSIHYKLGGSLADDPNYGEEHALRVEAAAKEPAKGRA